MKNEKNDVCFISSRSFKAKQLRSFLCCTFFDLEFPLILKNERVESKEGGEQSSEGGGHLLRRSSDCTIHGSL